MPIFLVSFFSSLNFCSTFFWWLKTCYNSTVLNIFDGQFFRIYCYKESNIKHSIYQNSFHLTFDRPFLHPDNMLTRLPLLRSICPGCQASTLFSEFSRNASQQGSISAADHGSKNHSPANRPKQQRSKKSSFRHADPIRPVADKLLKSLMKRHKDKFAVPGISVVLVGFFFWPSPKPLAYLFFLMTNSILTRGATVQEVCWQTELLAYFMVPTTT